MSKKSVVFALAMMMVASMAHAAGTWTFGLDGGSSIPMGDYGDVTKAGFSGGVYADMHFAPQWAAGIDMAYNKNDGKDLPAGEDFSSTIMQFSGHGKWMAQTQSQFQPWLMAGVGIYNLKAEATVGGVSGSATDTKFGFNVGAGTNFWSNPQMALGIGGQFHDIMTDGSSSQYVNVGLNLTFSTTGSASGK